LITIRRDIKMQWKKLGKIFDPTLYNLPNNCKTHAQSPQVLEMADRIRIFFSTREIDEIGKFLSNVLFVDFTKDLKEIIGIAKNKVIELGDIGCFDEHGIFPLNILRDGNKVLGYIGGWSRRVSVSVETSIGLAISENDGLSFTRIGKGPVITSTIHEPFLVGDPFVAKFNNIYHMWYIFGLRWINHPDDLEPQRVYKIGHAISEDGISWVKDDKQIIDSKLDEDECQALPTVIEINGSFHMLFCYRRAVGFRKNRDAAYRIGYAYSNDLFKWKRDDHKAGIDVSIGGWDADMMCYPHLFKTGERFFLLYNGNEFGKYGFGLAELESV